MAQRIQRKRSKGWRMPPGAVYVGRPTVWGNPFVVGEDGNAAECVAKYRTYITTRLKLEWIVRECLEDLRGHDLVCFCGLDQPCHADVLLELANNQEAAHD